MQVGKVKVFFWGINEQKPKKDILIQFHIEIVGIKGIDAWLHVNPNGKEKGLAMVFNPTGKVPHTFHSYFLRANNFFFTKPRFKLSLYLLM